MFCEVPLEGSGFLTLTLAYTSESLRRNGIPSGQFLTLDLPEIDFHGQAFVQCLQDTADAASRDGELLLAIQRRDERDPGVMLYGQGNLAQQALDQRRARSREIVLVIDKPNGDRADIRLIRSVDWIDNTQRQSWRRDLSRSPSHGRAGLRSRRRHRTLPTARAGCGASRNRYLLPYLR